MTETGIDSVVHTGAIPLRSAAYLMDMRNLVERIPHASVNLLFTSPLYPGAEGTHGVPNSDCEDLISEMVDLAVWAVKPDGVLAVNVADVPGGNEGLWRNADYVTACALDHGFIPRADIIWDKGMCGPLPPPCYMRRPTIPHLQYEHVLIYLPGAWRGREKKITLTHEEKEWNAHSIWKIAPVTGKRRGPTLPFPPALAQRVIRLFSLPGDIVLDPFGGLGTTAVAAIELGRVGITCDNSEACYTIMKAKVDDAIKAHDIASRRP